MRKFIAALALSALALGGATAVQAKQTGDEKLAKLLDGRVAGQPKSCIYTGRTDGMQVIEKTAIVYKDGDTIWVNRTAHPENLDRDDILVINRFSGSQLCKLDQVTTIDQGSGFFTGVVFLQDFVPYKKVEG
ncbi:MAG: hypothetical protein J7496_06200 [Novosphingobium sp.]|nr:hypothetical protein [Novosphingobium sp.]